MTDKVETSGTALKFGDSDGLATRFMRRIEDLVTKSTSP
jgi:hypothetical protein